MEDLIRDFTLKGDVEQMTEAIEEELECHARKDKIGKLQVWTPSS